MFAKGGLNLEYVYIYTHTQTDTHTHSVELGYNVLKGTEYILCRYKR
jgi:hypothetical protein